MPQCWILNVFKMCLLPTKLRGMVSPLKLCSSYRMFPYPRMKFLVGGFEHFCYEIPFWWGWCIYAAVHKQWRNGFLFRWFFPSSMLQNVKSQGLNVLSLGTGETEHFPCLLDIQILIIVSLLCFEGCLSRFTHANRHCPKHPYARLKREEPTDALNKHQAVDNQAAAEWLAK